MMHSHETQRDISPCVTHMNTVVENLPLSPSISLTLSMKS